MPYILTQAADPLAIAERQYGSGPEVRLPGISSCIGIVGKVRGGGVFGIHLGLLGSDGTPFALTDVGTVTARATTLQFQSGTVQIIGETDFWPANVLAALRAGLGNATINTTGSGNFAVTLSPAGTLTVTTY